MLHMSFTMAINSWGSEFWARFEGSYKQTIKKLQKSKQNLSRVVFEIRLYGYPSVFSSLIKHNRVHVAF